MSEEIHTASLPDFGFLYGCCYSCLCYPEQVITSLPTVPISIISHLPAFWYEVTAVKGMDELGASQIRLQRSADGVTWTTVKTYSSNDYSSMICENTGTHGGYATYSNVSSGYYCRARVDHYAKLGNGYGTYTDYITLRNNALT